MHKGLIISGMILGLCWAPASYAQKSSSLTKWVGKMPSSGKGFWIEKEVQNTMIDSIPTELVATITSGWGEGAVEAPIERRGNVLGVFVCKAHDCAAHAARLYYNFKQKTIQLCWTETHQSQLLDVWFAGVDVKRLAQGACADKDMWRNLKQYGKAGY